MTTVHWPRVSVGAVFGACAGYSGLVFAPDDNLVGLHTPGQVLLYVTVGFAAGSFLGLLWGYVGGWGRSAPAPPNPGEDEVVWPPPPRPSEIRNNQWLNIP